MLDSQPDRPSADRVSSTRLVFLGPQRFQPIVRETLSSLGLRGPVAVITAGWQERETEDAELRDHLGCEVVDLQLYRRADDVLLRDRGLAVALQERQASLRRLQELYRVRLSYMLDAARDLMRRSGREILLDEHRRGAIRAVRTLDHQHLKRIQRLRAEWDERFRPAERRSIVRHREQIARIVGDAAAVAVAGGHVAVLLNRMGLFDLLPLLKQKPVVAWSAGAMALSERVVLFHDSPPQGEGNPEVLDAGLGLGPALLPLPHAGRRLQLDDPVRVALFARRFAPDTCVALDPGARVDWDGASWSAGSTTRQLRVNGSLREMAGA